MLSLITISVLVSVDHKSRAGGTKLSFLPSRVVDWGMSALASCRYEVPGGGAYGHIFSSPKTPGSTNRSLMSHLLRSSSSLLISSCGTLTVHQLFILVYT